MNRFLYIFSKHHSYLLTLALKLTSSKEEAEDLIADFYLKLGEYFNSKPNKLDEISNIRAYLRKSMLNLFYSNCRKSRLQEDYISYCITRIPSLPDTQVKKFENKNLLEKIMEKAQLSDQEKRILDMWFINDLKHELIAKTEGIEKNELRVIKQRIRRKLIKAAK